MEKKKYSNLADYLDSLQGTEKELMMFFIDYMRLNHSELEEIFSFQMPTYKLGEGKIKNYIAFSAKPKHFSMHSLDFEYVSVLKEKLSNPGKGKGCVNIAYDNIFDKEILITAIEEIIERQNRRLNI